MHIYLILLQIKKEKEKVNNKEREDRPLFVGKSLTNIRILNNISRKELADKVGITEQAIWQYENNHVSPKLAVINKLKSIFNVKASYFLKEDLLSLYTNNINAKNIAYRSDSVNSLSKTQSETTHIRFIDAFLKKIEQRILYPANIIKDIREEVIEFINVNKNMERHNQIKHIAGIARKRIGLSEESNQNILFLFEKSGIFIFEKYIGDDIDAYSLWSEDDRAYIMLGTIRKTAARRNFDLAHELGHLLLHFTCEFTMQDTDSYRLLEKEANQFAGEFLIPEENFVEECNRIIKRSNPEAYIDMKKKWQVSLQFIAVRAFDLELINYQQYRYFFMLINKKDYKKIEPLDNVIPVKSATKVKSILQLLFEENLYTVSSLLDELNVDIKFLSQLTGIHETFFLSHQNNEERRFTVSELKVR